MNSVSYALAYNFAPGKSDDGVTLTVPQALEMMAENLGTAIDPDCFAALQAGIQDFSLYLTPEQPLANAS